MVQVAIARCCNLLRAFDIVYDDIILENIGIYGIRRNAFKFIKRQLTERYQLVDYNGLKLSVMQVNIDVPQGYYKSYCYFYRMIFIKNKVKLYLQFNMQIILHYILHMSTIRLISFRKNLETAKNQFDANYLKLNLSITFSLRPFKFYNTVKFLLFR